MPVVLLPLLPEGALKTRGRSPDSIGAQSDRADPPTASDQGSVAVASDPRQFGREIHERPPRGGRFHLIADLPRPTISKAKAMAEREVLEAILQHTAEMTPTHLKPELAHRHMVALADTYEGWAQDRRMSPERSARLLGWADGLRRLADELGPEWNPPTPPTVSAIGFLGRVALDEASPPPTPQLHRPDIRLRPDSVLASPLRLFSAWCLLATCAGCGETRSVPVSSVLSFARDGGSVASVVRRLRCHTCGTAPSAVVITEASNPGAGRQVTLV